MARTVSVSVTSLIRAIFNRWPIHPRLILSLFDILLMGHFAHRLKKILSLIFFVLVRLFFLAPTAITELSYSVSCLFLSLGSSFIHFFTIATFDLARFLDKWEYEWRKGQDKKPCPFVFAAPFASWQKRVKVLLSLRLIYHKVLCSKPIACSNESLTLSPFTFCKSKSLRSSRKAQKTKRNQSCFLAACG